MANEERLIAAYKLEDLIRSNSARYHHADDVIAAIAGQPTVDAVEVVRCKDCKYWVTYFDCCEKKDITMHEDDYCSFGERREGK